MSSTALLLFPINGRRENAAEITYFYPKLLSGLIVNKIEPREENSRSEGGLEEWETEALSLLNVIRFWLHFFEFEA